MMDTGEMRGLELFAEPCSRALLLCAAATPFVGCVLSLCLHEKVHAVSEVGCPN